MTKMESLAEAGRRRRETKEKRGSLAALMEEQHRRNAEGVERKGIAKKRTLQSTQQPFRFYIHT